MAVAAVTSTVTRTWVEGPFFKVLGTLAVAPAADTYATGGNPLNLAGASVKAQRTPQKVEISGRNGFNYVYVPGTDVTNGKLKVNTTADTELAAAAIPANLSGDTIQFEASWLGQN